MVHTKCLWLLPDVWGSYQMSRVLTKCLGLSPEWVDSTQEPPEDAVDERVVFDPNCLHFDHERGDIWQKNHCNVTIIPEISSVKCRMVCVMGYFISPHDSRQNRNVFNYKNRCLTVLDYVIKHCQRHNGPEGWVHLAKVVSKVQTQILIEFHLQNLDSASTKHQHLH